jgi:hypothetical protein
MLEAHGGYKWWFVLLGFTGLGLVPLVFLLVHLGNRVHPSCPSCGERRRLASYDGEVSAEAQDVWQAAKARDAQLFRRSQYVTLAVLATLLAAITTLVVVGVMRGWF